jgi:hypothetical protein
VFAADRAETALNAAISTGADRMRIQLDRNSAPPDVSSTERRLTRSLVIAERASFSNCTRAAARQERLSMTRTRKLAVVPPVPPIADPPHTTLRLSAVDELARVHRRIVVLASLVASTLDDTETPTDMYQPIDALTCEAMVLIAVDVATAAQEAAAIMTRAAERSHAEKGGVS